MKIIATSELTIYDDLKKICEKDKVLIDKRLALSIEAIKKITDEYKKYAKDYNNIVFQSKNAVIHSKNIHNCLLSNNRSRMYCLGKYTMVEIKKYFKNKTQYPKNNYSSESLLNLIKLKEVKNNDYLIIKGQDGRGYLEKEIKKLGGNVKVINIYKRVPIKSFIKEEDLVQDLNNYFIISSETALSELIKNIKKFKKAYNLFLVIPNKRLSENIKKSIFKDIMIICNSSDAKTYANRISDHNEKN